MRISSIYIFLFLLATTSFVYADDTTIVITDNAIPISSAFALFDKSPNSIVKPETPTAFGIEIIDAAKSGGLDLNNIGVSFSPYWISGLSDDLTLEEYLKPSLFDVLKQTTVISLVSVRDEGAFLNSIAIGFSCNPIPGNWSESIYSDIGKIDSLQKAKLRESNPLKKDMLQREADSLSKVIREMDMNRYGLIFQLASALRGDYKKNDFEKGVISRAGIWGTITYRMSILDFIWLCRYQGEIDSEIKDVFDTGARLVIKSESFELSTEYIYRFEDFDAIKRNHRLTGNATYAVNDDISVGFTFGKNFEPVVETDGNLVAQLHISLGSFVKELVNTQK